MANPTGRREEALRSALDRLNMPMMICDESQILQPLNERATVLFEAENLRGDLLAARPSHPLSRMISEILQTQSRRTSQRFGPFCDRGMSNEAIAPDIGVSPETVKTHVRNIFEKSGTHSRAEFRAAVLRTK